MSFIIVDENKNLLKNALLKIYRQNPSTNEDLLLTELYSHPDGKVTTKLLPEKQFYKFVVEYQNRTVYISDKAVSLFPADSPQQIPCIIEPAYTGDFLNYLGLDLSLTFTKIDNETGYHELYFNGEDTYEICFNNYYVINNVTFDLENYCINGSTASITFNNIEVSQYAKVYGEVQVDFKRGAGKEDFILRLDYLGLDDLSRQQAGRLFVYFGLVLLCAVGFIKFPETSLILFAIGTMVLSWTKFILLSPTIATLIATLSIFVAITMKKNEK